MQIYRNLIDSPGKYGGDAAALNSLDSDRSTGLRPPDEGEDDGGGAGDGRAGKGSFTGRFDSFAGSARFTAPAERPPSRGLPPALADTVSIESNTSRSRIPEQGMRLRLREDGVGLAGPVSIAPAAAPVIHSTGESAAQRSATVAAVWAFAQVEPYRLLQGMLENNVSAAELASSTGQTQQAIDDYLTRSGAPTGFAGANVVNRDAVNQNYLNTLDTALGADPLHGGAGGLGWTTSQYSQNDDGYNTSTFDIGAFNAWYTRQNTPEAQAFVALHGVDLSLGDLVVAPGGWQSQGDYSYESWAPSQAMWVGPAAQVNAGIQVYASYGRADTQARAAIDLMLSDPANQAVLAQYGNRSALQALPVSDQTERMRAAYGSERTGQMQALFAANQALLADYANAVAQARQQLVTVEEIGGPQPHPGWVLAEFTQYMDYGDSGGFVTVLAPQFDTAAFAAWYLQQDTAASRLLKQRFGSEISSTSGTSYSGGEGGGDSSTTWTQTSIGRGYAVLDADTGTMLQGSLVAIGLENPRDNLIDPAAVFFDPLLGFVTPAENIQQETDFLDQLIPIVMCAVVAYFTGGAASAAVLEAYGASAATAAAVVGAGVGAVASTSLMQLMTTGNIDLGSVFKNAVIAMATAGLSQGLGLDSMGTGKDALGSRIVTDWGQRALAIGGKAAFSGMLSEITGGNVGQNLMQSLLGSLSGEVVSALNLQISSNQDLSAAQRSICKTMATAVGSAIRIMGSPGDPMHAMASDFLSQLGIDAGKDIIQSIRASEFQAAIATTKPAPIAASFYDGDFVFDMGFNESDNSWDIVEDSYVKRRAPTTPVSKWFDDIGPDTWGDGSINGVNDEGNPMPGVVDPNATPAQQQRQLTAQLVAQGFSPDAAASVAAQWDASPVASAPLGSNLANEDGDGSRPSAVVITGTKGPDWDYVDLEDPILAARKNDAPVVTLIQHTQPLGSASELASSIGMDGSHMTTTAALQDRIISEQEPSSANYSKSSASFADRVYAGMDNTARMMAEQGRTDSAVEAYKTYKVPPGEAFAAVRELINPETGTLKQGVSDSDLSRAAITAGLPMSVSVAGITNSTLQNQANGYALAQESAASGAPTLVVSVNNATHGERMDTGESNQLKMGFNTATVVATKLTVQDVIKFNADLDAALATKEGLPVEARPKTFTYVWGHSEGSIIVNRAVGQLDYNSQKQVELRNLGMATGYVPPDVNHYVGVGNQYDFVYKSVGSGILANGGVANSPGFVEGNANNPGSYQLVVTNFRVIDDNTGAYDPGNKNHSWQYYFSDPKTRDAFGLIPTLSPSLGRLYGRSPWVKGE